MTKLIQTTLIAAVILLSSPSAPLAKEAAPKQPLLEEHYLGKADAPITIQEFASLTCSHCADFTVKILPELEKKYIETGKVRYIYRDFPIDGIALKASAIAHCMPSEQFYGYINVLSKYQKEWALSNDPEKILIQYAKPGGLNEDAAKACLRDADKLDALVAARTEAQDKYEIDSTPTFIFNEGQEKLIGTRKLEDFTAVIDRLLAAKK